MCVWILWGIMFSIGDIAFLCKTRVDMETTLYCEWPSFEERLKCENDSQYAVLIHMFAQQSSSALLVFSHFALFANFCRFFFLVYLINVFFFWLYFFWSPVRVFYQFILILNCSIITRKKVQNYFLKLDINCFSLEIGTVLLLWYPQRIIRYRFFFLPCLFILLYIYILPLKIRCLVLIRSYDVGFVRLIFIGICLSPSLIIWFTVSHVKTCPFR